MYKSFFINARQYLCNTQKLISAIVAITFVTTLAITLATTLVTTLSYTIPTAMADGPTGSPLPENQARFSVHFGDEIIPYNVFGVYVLPNQNVSVAALQTPAKVNFQLAAQDGNVTAKPNNRWQWQAPSKPGVYELKILPDNTSGPDDITGFVITLNAFVMHPASDVKNGRLNGFRIDAYPSKPLRGNPVYLPPKGYVEVTKDTAKSKIAPHFRLGEFVAKQKGGYPKYVVVQARLLLKLEMILERLKEAGYSADRMVVMSGYRTPYYNKSIGNVQYSRHKWGGAADIFIDSAPKDGRMDDLNNDGTVDIKDAHVIANLIEDIADDAWYQPMIGGLGVYGPKPHRGPFVHVDVRGSKARWIKP